MVTVAVSSPITTFGLLVDSVAVKSSVCSTIESSVIGTCTWTNVCWGENVTVFGDDAKSDPAVYKGD